MHITSTKERQETFRKKDADVFMMVSALFEDKTDFANAIEALHVRGYDDRHINVLMSETTKNMYLAPKEGTKAAETATYGGLTGGLIGALVGGLTAVGSVILPGVGLLVSGAAVGALAGATLGTATGGVIGAIIGSGIPEHEAVFFERSLKEKGKALLVVRVPKDEIKETEAVLERLNASHIKSYAG